MHAGLHTSVTDARCVYDIFPSGHFLWSDGRIMLMLRQTCLQVSDQLTYSRQQPHLMLSSRDLAWVVGSRWGFFQMHMGDGRLHQLITGSGALLKGTLAVLWSCPGTLLPPAHLPTFVHHWGLNRKPCVQPSPSTDWTTTAKQTFGLENKGKALKLYVFSLFNSTWKKWIMPSFLWLRGFMAGYF